MFFSRMEGILKNYSESNMKVLEFYYGVSLTHYRPVQDVHASVYGQHSGSTLNEIGCFVGIVVPDDFFTTGPAAAGQFEEGFLYTRYADIKVADVIQIVSKDKKTRRYTISSPESLGTQDGVFLKWAITNLAG